MWWNVLTWKQRFEYWTDKEKAEGGGASAGPAMAAAVGAAPETSDETDDDEVSDEEDFPADFVPGAAAPDSSDLDDLGSDDGRPAEAGDSPWDRWDRFADSLAAPASSENAGRSH